MPLLGRTLHFEIKNMFHNKRYGNLAVDSAAKFFSREIWQLIQLPIFFFHSGGAAWGRSAQAFPRMKKTEKQTEFVENF